MEDSGFKALNIAVGVIISVAIVSSFILVINEMVKIYKNTEKVNIDLLKVADEFEMYIDEDSVFYGIDVINTFRKYNSENYKDYVEVHLGKGNKINNENQIADKSKKYKAVVIDGNEVLDSYKTAYQKSQYKNKMIILFE